MTSGISDKDKKDWENFLLSKESLHDKDSSTIKKKNKKIKTFDLHGLSLDQANKKVRDLIFEANDQNIAKLIIVTGKGLHSNNEKDPFKSKTLGILKYSIPDYIKNDKELINMIYDIKDADIKDGGSGAFYIYLKKKK